MKLSFLLPPECIVTHICGGERSKRDVLAELTAILFQNTAMARENYSAEDVLENLLQRENELSTGVGDGFAFPHARLSGLHGAYLLLATCPDGVTYASPDNKNVNFLFLTVVSENHADLLLQVRAALMRFLLPLEHRAKALSCTDPMILWKFIDQNGSTISRDIVARDIMCPQIGALHKNMTIAEAAIAMHKAHSDLMPVVDELGKLQNVVSCRDLFKHAFPDMFFSMKTLSFAKHMDPFAINFNRNGIFLCDLSRNPLEKLPVADVNSTLTELLFQMCANNFDTLFVLENGFLKGVINRYALVDKILIGMTC